MRPATLTLTLGLIGAALLAAHTIHLSSQAHLQTTEVSGPIAEAFAKWTVAYKKHYATPSERTYRLSVFASNFELVAEMNKRHSHESALNFFADMTDEEFGAKFGGKGKAREEREVER